MANLKSAQGDEAIQLTNLSTALTSFFSVVHSIEESLEAEMVHIQARCSDDLSSFIDQKARGLQQLSRTIRTLNKAELEAVAKPRLSQLRAKLEENHNLLEMHLAAAREVNAIILRVLVDASSDGTYCKTGMQTAIAGY